MKFQILHIFLWMMACHNYSLSDWTLGHPGEPIHSEFYPSQKESFGRWSKMRKIRNDFICSGALSNTPQNNPLHVIARYTTLKECWILVLVNILLNLSLKYWDGVTKILISSLKILIAFSWNGTSSTSFFPLWFRVSSRGKPLTPSAFVISSSQYLISGPETPNWTPSDRLK